MPEPQRLKYTDLAPQGIAALRVLEHYANTAAQLEPILLELVRLRASLLNGCDYCVGLHTHELQKHNETQVPTWSTSAAYTHREQAALAWTEVVTNIQDGHAPQPAFEQARQHFTDTELVNLTLAIASINAWNRLAIAFRAQHTPKPDAQAPIADDGGKVAVDE
jgi:AhpD family alkylhydroperoxidase